MGNIKIFTIWKERGKILEGIKNNIFKREDVEVIAEQRMNICKNCPSECYNEDGKGCMVVGTAPCCDERKGGCGCSLAFKTRSLSSDCPFKHWKAEMSDHEEDMLIEKLAL